MILYKLNSINTEANNAQSLIESEIIKLFYPSQSEANIRM